MASQPSVGAVCRHTFNSAAQIGIGFASCDRDCVGAAVTDFMLAFHALYSVRRTLKELAAQRKQFRLEGREPRGGGRRRPFSSRPWSFATVACGLMFANGIWCSFGSLYWLQPGGRKIYGFEVLWRLNAQCQAALLYFSYLICLTLVRIGGLCPPITRHERTLARVALFHAVVFGLICLLPSACQQHEYVLWGGANIMPPFLSQWYIITTLNQRHALHKEGGHPQNACGGRYHPVHIATLSGIFFWVGNSGIIVGRDGGVAKWMRDGISYLLGYTIAREGWEEMATFHLFGMFGNDWLFRFYEWVALKEAESHYQARAPPPASSPASPQHPPQWPQDEPEPLTLRHMQLRGLELLGEVRHSARAAKDLLLEKCGTSSEYTPTEAGTESSVSSDDEAELEKREEVSSAALAPGAWLVAVLRPHSE